MVPWFEFYLPWNVLLEPFPLVAVELLCWAGVLLVVALMISGVDRLVDCSSMMNQAVAAPITRMAAKLITMK